MNKTPDEIKIARAWLGLTQVELAGVLDIHVKSLRNMEQGIRPCRGPVAVLLELLSDHTDSGPACARPKYKDIAAEDWAACADYATAELKYDGYYTELLGGHDGWRMYSRGGTVIESSDDPLPRCRVLCEHIEGTEWAAESGLRGRLVAWSAVDCTGKHLSRPDLERLVGALAAAGVDVGISDQHPADDADMLWGYAVMRRGWEGLVLRGKDGSFARMKARTTVDYIAMGYEDGSIMGSLYTAQGRLTHRVRVPYDGPRSVVTGAVFQASGLRRTNSGSLRNPRFDRWRPDKAPEECI